MRVSVIVRCCNEERDIGRLLAGILRQRGDFEPEIVVVDSGSTDRTLEVVGRYPTKVVHIPQAAFSFGRSLNWGCAAATGEILAIASAHVYPVYDDWLQQLVTPLLANPQIALVYGKQRGDKDTQFSEHRIFARWFPEVSTPWQTHPFCNNANAALRRSLWAQLPYDETLTGLEDLAWAKAVLALGYGVAYQAEAEVVHRHRETWGRIFNRYRREAIALQQIFPATRFSAWDLMRLWSANVAGDSLSALNQGQLWAKVSSILSFRAAQFWGTYRGFHTASAAVEDLRQIFYYPAPWQAPPPSRRQAVPLTYEGQGEPHGP
ncbi:MAG: glycosyltransferase family 2 protein [Oscillatoriales cyanobacterium SM2_1_8]|nr:glycosyltransferase family 2 protein [Oscillatoriales cyanobacterium SM2_1_8]